MIFYILTIHLYPDVYKITVEPSTFCDIHTFSMKIMTYMLAYRGVWVNMFL